MTRFVGELISLIFFFLMVRSALTGISQLWRRGPTIPNPAHRNPEDLGSRSEMKTSGELRKDPVCGTFVTMSSPYTRVANGVTSYFCSKECLDRYKSQTQPGKEWRDSTTVRS